MIHELKKYVPTPGNAVALRQRFQDTTIPIFKRLGIEVLHCWILPDEPDAFSYLVAFADDESRRQAWAAFGADPEWKAAKAASESSGPLLANQTTVTLQPTSFSPDRLTR